jgi:hypothetical protein
MLLYTHSGRDVNFKEIYNKEGFQFYEDIAYYAHILNYTYISVATPYNRHNHVTQWWHECLLCSW